MQIDEEFIASLVILGGLAFAGLMLSGVLGWLVIAYRNRLTRNKVKRELYEQKERKNGHDKTITTGKW